MHDVRLIKWPIHKDKQERNVNKKICTSVKETKGNDDQWQHLKINSCVLKNEKNLTLIKLKSFSNHILLRHAPAASLGQESKNLMLADQYRTHKSE